MNTIPTNFPPNFRIHQSYEYISTNFHLIFAFIKNRHPHSIKHIKYIPPPSFSDFPLQNASIFPRYQINVLKEEILVFQTVFL